MRSAVFTNKNKGIMKTITNRQVKEIAKEVSKRWRFVNHDSYYNCIDTKTGQQSNQGGDYNFASYHFMNKVEAMYLNFINENALYFDWQTNGVKETNERKSYVFRIENKVVELLCGFTTQKQAA